MDTHVHSCSCISNALIYISKGGEGQAGHTKLGCHAWDNHEPAERDVSKSRTAEQQ